MAIYHLCVKAVSRTTNRSAVAAAAYRACVKLTDERTDRVYDYRPRELAGSLAELAYIILPVGIFSGASWVKDRSTLWNRAEIEAKRKDAKTAREVEVAIPAELDEEAASEFGRAMGAYLANRFRVAVDVARHTPSREGDDRNRHLHMLMTTREITVDGFGPRTAELDNKFSGAIGEIRARCAILTNAALERAGSPVRVDHRSYADQGIDRVPGIHLGDACGMERRNPDLRTRIGDRQREIEAINADIAAYHIARREHDVAVAAAAGQEQRAAFMAAMRDSLGLSRSDAPDRSRRSKRMQKAVSDNPGNEVAPATPAAPHHAPDKRRRETFKRRKSRASVLDLLLALPPLAQDAAPPARNPVKPAWPTRAPSSSWQTPKRTRRPQPPVIASETVSSGDRPVIVQPLPATQAAVDRVTSDLNAPLVYDPVAGEAALQSALARAGRSLTSQPPIIPAAIQERVQRPPGPVQRRSLPDAAPVVPKTVQQSPAASQAASEPNVAPGVAPPVQSAVATNISGSPAAAIWRLPDDGEIEMSRRRPAAAAAPERVLAQPVTRVARWDYDPERVWIALRAGPADETVPLQDGPTKAASSAYKIIQDERIPGVAVHGNTFQINVQEFASNIVHLTAEVAERLLVLLRTAADETKALLPKPTPEPTLKPTLAPKRKQTTRPQNER